MYGRADAGLCFWEIKWGNNGARVKWRGRASLERCRESLLRAPCTSGFPVNIKSVEMRLRSLSAEDSLTLIKKSLKFSIYHDIRQADLVCCVLSELCAHGSPQRSVSRSYKTFIRREFIYGAGKHSDGELLLTQFHSLLWLVWGVHFRCFVHLRI